MPINPDCHKDRRFNRQIPAYGVTLDSVNRRGAYRKIVTAVLSVSIGVFSAIVSPQAHAVSRDTDHVFVNPYNIPCDGVQYLVKNGGYQGAYTEGASTSILIQNGTSTTLKASRAKSVKNTVTDTMGFSAKLAIALLQTSPSRVSGELTYSEAHTISQEDSVTFSYEQTLPIKSLGTGDIRAEPVYYKAQAYGDYWVREKGSGESCKPQRTADRMQIDAVTATGWYLSCGGRKCVPGRDFEGPNPPSTDIPQREEPKIFFDRVYPRPLTEKYVESCLLWAPGRPPNPNMGLCYFYIPQQCDVRAENRTSAPQSWHYYAFVRCPETAPYRGYRIIQKSAWYDPTEISQNEYPRGDKSFRAKSEYLCTVGPECGVSKTGQYDFGSIFGKGMTTGHVVIPLY